MKAPVPLSTPYPKNSPFLSVAASCPSVTASSHRGDGPRREVDAGQRDAFVATAGGDGEAQRERAHRHRPRERPAAAHDDVARHQPAGREDDVARGLGAEAVARAAHRDLEAVGEGLVEDRARRAGTTGGGASFTTGAERGEQAASPASDGAGREAAPAHALGFDGRISVRWNHASFMRPRNDASMG